MVFKKDMQSATESYPAAVLHGDQRLSTSAQYLWVFVINTLVALVGWGIVPHVGYVVVGMVFLLAGIFATLHLERGPLLLLAFLNVLTWDYFFIQPVYAFRFEKLEDMLICGMSFLVVMGTFLVQLKQRDIAERRHRIYTTALLNVTQSAALAMKPSQGLATALRTINEVLQAETALIVRNADLKLPHSADAASTFHPAPSEWDVIIRCYQEGLTTGRFTSVMPQAYATWFPLRTANTVMGVLGIRIPAKANMEFSMQQTINAFALQLALVLEKEQFIHALNQAEVEEASEKLRHILLDSVSHELKTPLAALQSATDDIAQNPDEAIHIVPELQSALRRLRRTVDNLLNMTRVESGDVTPMLDWCDVDELCDAAVELIGDALIHHRFYLNVPKNLPIVKVDRALIEQALVNFLLNAAMHTPSGCEVILRAYMQDQTLMLSVLDRGPGLPNMNLDDLFQKFVRGTHAPAGGSGLGLAIARGFARAHAGEATACPREGGGAEFTLKLPVETLDEFTDETCPPYSPCH